MKTISKFKYHQYGPDARFTHDPTQETFWQESCFLFWYDEAARIGGAMRIGLEPNLEGGGVALWSNLITPDHAFYHRTDRLKFIEGSRGERAWAAGDLLQYHYDAASEIGGRWRLRDDGAALDLQVEDLHPPVALFPEEGWTIKDKMAKRHLECGVRVSGEAELHGRRYKINGMGYRDHSWGVREWRASPSHRWLTGVLGDRHSFAMCAWSNADGTTFKHGYFCDYQAKIIQYTDEIDELVFVETDGCSHRGGVATMRLPDGTIHRFVFEPLARGAMTFYGGVACLDTPCKVTCGDLSGIADFETSTNPHRGDLPPPRVPVSAILENGLYTSLADIAPRRPLIEI